MPAEVTLWSGTSGAKSNAGTLGSMFPEEAPPTIRGYRILRRLESRRGARVYLARGDATHGFSRDVALKLVADATEGDAAYAEELAREAVISEQLQHPSILRMYDFFQDPPWLVLVLEVVDGTSLSRLLDWLATRKQALPQEAAWYVASCVTEALAHAHALTDGAGAHTPVIHRDVSPPNVLLSRDASVKLAGFGLGKILDRTPETAIGVIKGSPGYMAPEQLRGERPTEKVDVYGAALLAWQLVTGKAPDPLLHGPALIAHMAGGDVDAMKVGAPKELVAALEAALEPDPITREISCDELARWIAKVADVDRGRRALRTLVEQMADGPPPPTIPPGRPSTRAIAKPAKMGEDGRGVAVSSSDSKSNDSSASTSPQGAPPRPSKTPLPSPAVPRAPAPRTPARPVRMGTLFGIGTKPLDAAASGQVPAVVELTPSHLEPHVSETQRVVSSQPTMADTQRVVGDPIDSSGSLVAANPHEGAPMLAAPPPAAFTPSPPVAAPLPTPSPAQAAEELEAELVVDPSGATVVRPPREPPKPLDRPMPAMDAPRVVLDPTARPPRSMEDLRDTVISSNRARLAEESDDDTISRARRKRSRLIVLGVVGFFAFVGLIGLVVALVSGKSKSKDKDDVAATDTNKTKGGAKTPGDDSTTSATTTDTAAPPSKSGTSVVVKTTAKSTSDSPDAPLKKGMGRLVVEATIPDTDVFIGDRNYGPPGESMVVPCGYRWVLLGKADPKGKLQKKLTKSQSVFIECGKETKVKLKP